MIRQPIRQDEALDNMFPGVPRHPEQWLADK